MTHAVTKGKFLLIAAALGLAILTLAVVGCQTAPATAVEQGETSQADLVKGLNPESLPEAARQSMPDSQDTGAGEFHGIWATAQGDATAEPDIAILNLGVEAFAGTVAEARGEGAAAMVRVIDAIKAKEIEDRDIQTTFFNISARYTTVEVTRCGPEAESQGPVTPQEQLSEGPTGDTSSSEECVVERQRVIQGYNLNNQISVQVRNLDSIGELIDEATTAGGDLIRFQGVTLFIEDAEALKEAARAEAVNNLLSKAAEIAGLAGVDLGRLVYISESDDPWAGPQLRYEEGFLAAATFDRTPVQIGELSVTVRVRGGFAIAGQ